MATTNRTLTNAALRVALVVTDTGLGLGLAIVREIVHAHKGTADAESVVRVGRWFTVRLPVEA